MHVGKKAVGKGMCGGKQVLLAEDKEEHSLEE